ncbi:unnamed protein product [Somion occarium]|uniref:GATA-type domain-containing protein n=1 Tax=Somion occarium TaxID=3059160 RepID=A0ABP1DPW0_9APHY
MARAAYYSDRLSLPHEPPGPPGPQGTPYSEHTVGNRELHHDIAGTDTENQTDHGHLRQCSVRGCTTVLPPDYLQKMCESCRGRHRIYASTKRAKRKMEKLAIGGQLGPVVWMPPHSDGRDDHPQAGPSTQPTPPVEDSTVSHYPLTASSWESSAIDPSLFSQESGSFSQNPHSPTQAADSYTQVPSPYGHYSSTGAYTQDDNTGFPQNSDGQHYPQHANSGTYSQNVDTSPFSQGPSPYHQHSELAGALNLPHHQPQPQHAVQQVFQQSAPQNTPLPAPVPHQASPSFSDLSSSRAPSRLTSTPAIPTGEISAKAISEVAPAIGGTTLPHRYCSVKGCKAVVPGDSYFKMCEPCRNRYRSYGTTKRAKWKREKEAAIAELQKLREEDDRKRAALGLPPLAEGEWASVPPAHLLQAAAAQMPGDMPFAQTVQSITPRMCTVSHCREVLPPDYEFLRCERHRIQNRHHSKLKRVRDKESKAVAFEDWSVAAAANAQVSQQQESVITQSPFIEEEKDEETRQYIDPVIPDTEGTGMPPAARGSRRTNHVCSIKACCNLLSLSNPWKMCDSCRDRDRTTRKIKTLRDNGVPVDPLPPRAKTPPELTVVTKAKKKSAPKKNQKKDEQSQEPVASTSQLVIPIVPNNSNSLEFMNPLGPHNSEDTEFILADDLANADDFPIPPRRLPTRSPGETPTASSTPTATEQPMDLPLVKKKRMSKDKTSSANQSVVSTSSGSTPSPSATGNTSTAGQPPQTAEMSPMAPSSAAAFFSPHYPIPYIIPPAFMPHFPSGARYPSYNNNSPSSYGREPYAPSPMYQPPYPGYPPYPYSWGPWAAGYPATLPPAAQAPTSTQTSTPTSPPAATASTVHAAGASSSSSPSVSTSSTAQTSPQSSRQPPPTPADRATMYSMFSSRPPGASHKTHTNTTPYDATGVPARPDPLKVAFSIRPNAPSQTGRKRQAEQEAPGHTNKRQELENSGTVTDIPEISEAQFAAAVSAIAASASDLGGHPLGALHVASHHAPSSPGKRPTCANKTCHRPLPASANASGTGVLCDKCKERIKKKAVVAKRRFKLEPRNLVGSTLSSGRTEGHGRNLTS